MTSLVFKVVSSHHLQACFFTCCNFFRDL